MAKKDDSRQPSREPEDDDPIEGPAGPYRVRHRSGYYTSKSKF